MEPERPSHGSGHAVKPALRKQPSQPSQHSAHGIVWNEENLAENEKIKASLPQVKINEPKTPFHELLPDDDVDLQPLALDGDAPPAAGNGHAVNGSTEPSEVSEEHKKQFAEARRAHYKMKDALAHKPIDDEDDDEELPAANRK